MKQIKEIYQVTIGDFNRMECTGSLSQFKTWFNILPTFLFRKQIDKLIADILKEFSEKENDINLSSMEWKIKSILNIHRLESSLIIVYNEFITGIELTQLKDKYILKRFDRRRIKDKTGNNLGDALDYIKMSAGIELKDGSLVYDYIEKVQKYITYRKDKFNETFGKQDEKTDQKKITLMQYAGGFASYMGYQITGLSKTTIPELIILKERAEAKYKAEVEQYNKMKS